MVQPPSQCIASNLSVGMPSDAKNAFHLWNAWPLLAMNVDFRLAVDRNALWTNIQCPLFNQLVDVSCKLACGPRPAIRRTVCIAGFLNSLDVDRQDEPSHAKKGATATRRPMNP
jgi:hypothetical protein